MTQKGSRTIKGRPVCLTAWDLRGRAHIRHPLHFDETVCGRKLDKGAAAATGKSCMECSEGAAKANELLRSL